MVIKTLKLFKTTVRKTEKISAFSGAKTKGYHLIYGFDGVYFIQSNNIKDAYDIYKKNYKYYDSLIPKTSYLRDGNLTYEKWTPTSKNINALPKPIRRFICETETISDLSELTRENIILSDLVKSLEKEVEELKKELDK